MRCPLRDGRVDVSALLARLFDLEVRAVLVEGGGEVHAAFLDASVVDRVALFVAPLLLGGRAAPGVIGGEGRELKSALRLERPEVTVFGDDLLIEGDVISRDGGRLNVHRHRGRAGDRARACERKGDVVRLDVAARATLEGSEIGASVAVNGACLTVVALRSDGFAFDVGPETLARTTLGPCAPASA